MRRAIGMAAALVLAGCGQAPDGGSQMADTAVDGAAAPQPANGGKPAAIPVSLPQMAYTYGYRFRVPADRIARAQQAHLALCDSMGPARCQVLALSSDGDDSEGSSAGSTLELRVAAGEARAFGGRLAASVAQAGGRGDGSTIEAEDVSKKIVDTEARLRQRELLAQRLTEVLRTRNGTVKDLVEAERSVAAAQEEIDQARGWLTELRGRVAMAEVGIVYDPLYTAAGGSGSGLGEAVRDSWTNFSVGMVELVRLAIYLLPWLVALGLVALAVRAGRRRLRTAATTRDCDAGPRPL
ncbi:DUF4349 domain-containing protein [Sphingomonas sp. ac-8]|uniref:DUF4349 domain-containing protein n=1 Tax=Sphingomonas sp. ac-8 TaxID=3242977 RepID=UPI003A80110F